MKRYYFRIYQGGDEDGSNVWVDAVDRKSAETQIRSEYHSIDDLIFIKSQKV